MAISDTHTLAPSPLTDLLERAFVAGARGVKILWRSALRGAGSRRKVLIVRETAALGDRRFVSVIQFERQRFLIGSSPSSVALLSVLSDEGNNGETVRNETVSKENKEPS